MNVPYTPCKIMLVTGYLGAGKTTLLNQILTDPGKHKVAVIVNDIGEVNIDARLIAKNGGSVSEQTGDLVPLTNGCICCTLSEDLAKQLSDLACSKKYDYIVIEASGICEPIPIAQTITMMAESTKQRKMPPIVELDNVVCVVDAARIKDEFGCGQDLLTKAEEMHASDDDDDEEDEEIASLLVQQLEFVNTVILNKTDLVTEDEKGLVRAMIKAFAPKAEIVETSYGKVPYEQVFDTGRFDYESAIMSAGWIEAIEHPEEHEEGELYEYGIETFVFERREPFFMQQLQSVFEQWPTNIIRTKGYIWFNENPDAAFILEQAGRQVTIQPDGMWLASAPEKERKKAFKEYPDLEKDWDSYYGDRVNRLVIIGQDIDKEAVTRALNVAIDEDFKL